MEVLKVKPDPMIPEMPNYGELFANTNIDLAILIEELSQCAVKHTKNIPITAMAPTLGIMQNGTVYLTIVENKTKYELCRAEIMEDGSLGQIGYNN